MSIKGGSEKSITCFKQWHQCRSERLYMNHKIGAILIGGAVFASSFSTAYAGHHGHNDGLALAAGIVGLTAATVSLLNPPIVVTPVTQTAIVTSTPVVASPAPVVYSAPAVAPAPVVYSAPAVAPAPVVYSAPVVVTPPPVVYTVPVPVMVAPVPMVYPGPRYWGPGRPMHHGGGHRPDYRPQHGRR